MTQITRFLQLATAPLMKIVFWPLVKRKNIYLQPNDIKRTESYLIVSNHQGALDGMIVCYLLPFSVQGRQAPYHFMMANKFFNLWLFNPLFIAWGIFPAKHHPLFNFGLEHATSLLSRKHTVMIFPEGKVGRFDRQYSPRKGVEVLTKLDGVKLLPTRVRWNRRKGLFKSYSLAVGKPFNGKNMTAEQIMDVVYSLKFR